MNFNHKNGCQKCETDGQFNRSVHRMSFPRLGALRTDVSFRERSQPQHHKEYSSLENLPIDMVNDFPTSDPLHLLHHGVMKKMLSMWIEGSTLYDFKWTKRDIREINQLICECSRQMPTDMHRSLRTLDYWKYWKGTEFRTFLMYSGIVILKDVLQSEEYEHYLTLCCAVRICSTNVYAEMLPLANELFAEFVESFISIYGQNNVVSNVHNVLHIYNDIRRFGNLNTISTYEFENCLRLMKLNLQSRDAPLEQLSRRLIEMSLEPRLLNSGDSSNTFSPQLKYRIMSNENHSTFKFIKISSDTFLSIKKFGDKWFLTKDNNIVEMKYAYRQEGVYFVHGTPLKVKHDFFIQPFSSRYADIFVSEIEMMAPQNFKIDCIKCKMICLSYHHQYVFIPILHSFQN